VALERSEETWDPQALTESLVIFLFTLNSDVRLERTSSIVGDARIFPVLLNVYLNTLLLQSHHHGHFHSQQQDKLAFILLSKVFKLTFGNVSSPASLPAASQLTRAHEVPHPVPAAVSHAVFFLKQTLLMQPKFPQKLTFNFLRQFSSEGQTVSFNELNLRKCLTIRLGQSTAGSSQTPSKSLLQVLNDFTDPTQVESLAILLRFSLDSDGDSHEEWCQQVLAALHNEST